MALSPSSDELPSDTVRIADLVGQIGQSVRAARQASSLTPVQWETLRFLSLPNQPARNPSGLSTWLGLTKGAASQTVASLAKLGFILRLPDPRDGRGLTLDLTNAGRRMTQSDPLLAIARALANLPAPAIATIDAALTETLAAMPTARGKGPGLKKRAPETGDRKAS
ncbi:MAG: MarR family transcriptional regulator [Rhodospirillaceae bacterium]|nr:MarR family transcriptional regulator [Rhodospirillaceae bacterium]